ncbi:nonribosomal peptide synthase [Aspergillus niger]|nr:nonribosomal peptide synthase [Aspergillus niger]
MSQTTPKPDMNDTDVSSFQEIPEGDLIKIWQWNKISPSPIMRCVHEICEEKARSQPDALAISAWDGELHYGELVQLAAKLANWLILSGVRPGMAVPLCFEKSRWTSVAMLGVLKAGAAFVMLDTSLPKQRLQAIVESANADLILSSVPSKDMVVSLAKTVIAIDSTFFSALNKLERQDPPPVHPSSAMYLTFTSGSTGAPKGLVITHTNYASSLYYQLPLLGFTKRTRFYDFSSYGFDASLSHTFTILAAGGCLCVPSEQDRKCNLAQSISSLRANAIGLTPSVARLLNPADIPTLEIILFLGEALSLADVQRWWGKVKISNIYGPSECTPYALINTGAASPQEATRIGKGAGLVTWVVDPDNPDHLLPLGETGELLLEGPLVGEGYLNDAERTARVFIHDPVWLRQGASNIPGRSGQRLYKTGDLVYYNDDGSLIYTGRKDTQIKIHGQRVELGEIEFCLEQHMPEAKQVIVDTITVKQEESSTVLAAFVQPHQTSANANGPENPPMEIFHVPRNVIHILAESLPIYMIPSIFLSIRDVPRTMSDKSDRKKLRELGALWFQQFSREKNHVVKGKPTSHVGIELQKIWGGVLGIDPESVGLRDNFFRLGGDSIAAMKVVSKAQQAGLGLTFSEIFQYPTFGSLEGRCRPERGNHVETISPYSLLKSGWNEALLQEDVAQYQLDLNTVEDAYPCTPLQEGLLSLSLQNLGTYMTQRVLGLHPTIDTREFCCAWEMMARSTPILRTRIIQHGDMGFLQVALKEDVQWIHATELQQYLEKDKTTPMGLGKPLVRCAIVTDDIVNRRWFVLTLHHAVYDGWSMPLLFERLNDAYKGMSERPTQPEFKAFIKYIQGQSHERAVEYWRDHLAECDCAPFPSLPSAVQWVKTNSEITQKLPSISIHTPGVTPAILVRSSCALLLSCMTKSKKVVFGITTSGRSAPVAGIEEIVGPTIATIPLYVNIQESQTVIEYLTTMQQHMTSMIPFEQFGLHNIAKTSSNAHQACMFQTLLIIQPQETGRVDNIFGKWEEWHRPEWDDTYALVLEVQLGTGRVNARFDSSVIRSWIVQDLLEGLNFMIKQLCTAVPNRRIADIAPVPPPSLERIWEWNVTVPCPVRTTMTEMIKKQVDKQPTALAIHAWDGDLTYAATRPTICNLTPTVARLLDPQRVYDLETLILLGEPVTRHDIDRWESSNVHVINAYGPAECTPISTINASQFNTAEATRIGKGAGLITWIVHPENHNRLVPPGCTGELLLEGPLVGLGYMNNPGKSGEAFVEDPEWLLLGSPRHPGRRGRLYKTGDLVQYNEDGSLTFMGRKDNQVKIRGQRVELGDIEYHVLASLPTKAIKVVAEVVGLENDGEPKPVLVAFIHMDNNGMPASKEPAMTAKTYHLTDVVRERISRELSIVPDVFISMLELPVTSTGKIDRKQLRDIGRSLLLSEGHVFDNTSHLSLNGDLRSELILHDEQPAYTLAQKAYSMRPAWVKGYYPRTEGGFRDILLHSSGLDSVNMMELTSFISRQFNIQVDMQYVVAKSTTIRSLAEYVLHYQTCSAAPSSKYNSTGIDLMSEINRHDSGIRAAQLTLSGRNSPSFEHSFCRDNGSFTVFLTGANGFLGTQLLRQLLSHRNVSRVICLVRGDTDAAARQRTISIAKEALWWTEHHAEKLEVWRGDLALPKLGLDPSRWEILTCGKAVDAIIHNGATVHWTKSYEALEAANVGSSIELLLVALRCPAMRFLYITGGRPWKAHEEGDVVAELSAPDAIPYSQTKLISEVVIRRAATRSLPGTFTSATPDKVAVINPGWVIGTPTEGYSNTTDYIWRLVATCVKLGVYNADDAEGWLSISDATTTAEEVLEATFSTRSDILGDEYATHGMAWREFWAILEDMGYKLEGKMQESNTHFGH